MYKIRTQNATTSNIYSLKRRNSIQRKVSRDLSQRGSLERRRKSTPFFDLRSTCVSFDDPLALTLVELQFVRKSTQVFHRQVSSWFLSGLYTETHLEFASLGSLKLAILVPRAFSLGGGVGKRPWERGCKLATLLNFGSLSLKLVLSFCLFTKFERTRYWWKPSIHDQLFLGKLMELSVCIKESTNCDKGPTMEAAMTYAQNGSAQFLVTIFLTTRVLVR